MVPCEVSLVELAAAASADAKLDVAPPEPALDVFEAEDA
jgi:hypothetical protein